MSGEWRDVALEDVADELTVGYVGPMASEYVNDGVPFLRSLNVEPLRINKNDLKFITPEFHRRIQKSRLTPGDVVIVRTGKPGACSVVPDWLAEANCSDLVIVRCGRQLNNRFLAYYVNTVASGHVAAHLVGAVQQHFNVSSARTLRLSLPPLAEQKAIAAVLGALDDKIELNRRMNAKLEEMARELFQSWFVDFDPVRAKLDGRQPAGLDPATAALFPDSFQDSTLGTIPHGWRAVHLESIASVGSGKRPEGRSDVLSPECNIPLYGGGGRIGYVTSALYDQPILLTGRVGTLGLIFRTAEPSWPSDNTLIVEPQPGLLDFTYFLLKGFDLLTLNRGSTQPLLTQADLKRQALVLPAKDVVKVFTDVSEPIFRKISSNERESCTLATLRNSLLPKLLSGELHINE
jgi:type I restriction enzyme, S subunit